MKKSIFLLMLLPVFMFSQHNIQGKLTPADNFTFALVYKSNPTDLEYVSRGAIDAKGDFKIELEATAPAGIYKVVYGLPQEENNFDLIYSGKEDVSLTFNLDEGLQFTESNENKLWASYTKSMELVNMTISNYYAHESTDEKAFTDIFKTLKDTQEAFEDASKETMVSVFIKSNRPYIPTTFEDISTYSKNLKKTYLQSIDFNNELLQSSNFLSDRLLAYIFGMSANTDNDTYKQRVDEVVTVINDINIDVKTALVLLIWNRFTETENPTLANYITNTYLLDLAKETNNNTLLKTILTYRDTAVGEVALDFAITYSENGKTIETSLQKLEIADHYLIIFWSSTCFHCLDELPKVKTFINEHPKNLKVIAIALEDDDSNWNKAIANYPDFIHVLGLGKWDNTIANDYGVDETPSYFVLDQNKTIVAKPKDIEALEMELSKLH